MTEKFKEPEVFKDPVSKQTFTTKLTDEQIQTIMKQRFDHDRALSSLKNDNAPRIKELETELEQLKKKEAEAEAKISDYDEMYLPGVRATVLDNREKFHRNDTYTAHYQIATTVYKKGKPKYDEKEPTLVEWTKQNHPEAIKPDEIAKGKLNKILKDLPEKELPAGVELEIPDSKVSIIKLEL